MKGRNDKDSISKDRIPGIILEFFFQPTNIHNFSNGFKFSLRREKILYTRKLLLLSQFVKRIEGYQIEFHGQF